MCDSKLKKDGCFVLTHWVIVIVIAFLIIVIRVPELNTTAYNMTRHCGDETYNQPLTYVTSQWAVTALILVSLVVVITRFTKIALTFKTRSESLEIANYLLGFVMCWNIITICKNAFSVPIPSFYQNEELKFFYCCKNCPPTKTTSELHEIDVDARGRFPSLIMCGIVYNTVYTFLMSSELNKVARFIIRILAVMVPGAVALVYGSFLVLYNQNFWEDIVVGGIIGAIVALYILQDNVCKKKKDTSPRGNNTDVTEECTLPERSLNTIHERCPLDLPQRNVEILLELCPLDLPQRNLNPVLDAGQVSHAPISELLADEAPPPYSRV